MKVAFLAGFTLFLSLSHSTPCYETEERQSFLKSTEIDSNELAEQAVYNYIRELGIIFPEIVLRQAILETGHFKSKVCIKNHNLFGMKMPRRRTTTALHSYRGYAMYKHWKDSVLDYKYWQEFNLKGAVITDYYQFLMNKKYSTSNSYRSKLKSIRLDLSSGRVE